MQVQNPLLPLLLWVSPVIMQLADFVDKHCLKGSVKCIKEIADQIKNLKRVGPGHGEWHMDEEEGQWNNNYRLHLTTGRTISPGLIVSVPNCGAVNSFIQCYYLNAMTDQLYMYCIAGYIVLYRRIAIMVISYLYIIFVLFCSMVSFNTIIMQHL